MSKGNTYEVDPILYAHVDPRGEAAVIEEQQAAFAAAELDAERQARNKKSLFSAYHDSVKRASLKKAIETTKPILADTGVNDLSDGVLKTKCGIVDDQDSVNSEVVAAPVTIPQADNSGKNLIDGPEATSSSVLADATFRSVEFNVTEVSNSPSGVGVGNQIKSVDGPEVANSENRVIPAAGNANNEDGKDSPTIPEVVESPDSPRKAPKPNKYVKVNKKDIMLIKGGEASTDLLVGDTGRPSSNSIVSSTSNFKKTTRVNAGRVEVVNEFDLNGTALTGDVPIVSRKLRDQAVETLINRDKWTPPSKCLTIMTDDMAEDQFNLHVAVKQRAEIAGKQYKALKYFEVAEEAKHMGKELDVIATDKRSITQPAKYETVYGEKNGQPSNLKMSKPPVRETEIVRKVRRNISQQAAHIARAISNSSSRLFVFFGSNSANKTFRRAVASRIGGSKAFREYLGIFKDWSVRAVTIASLPASLAEVIESYRNSGPGSPSI